MYTNMGTFMGHVLSGSIFLVFGMWQLLNTFTIIIRNKKSNKNNSDNELKHFSFGVKFPCCLRSIPAEGIFKVISCIFGMIMEGKGRFWGYGKYQHVTMYGSFGFCGIIDILLFIGQPIPMKFDYVMHAISFLLEGLTFTFPLHGRNIVDTMVHRLVVYICFFTALCLFLCCIGKRISLLRILISLSMLIQGSWFYQIGFILHNPIRDPWKVSHENIMLIVVTFYWHVIFNLILVMVIYLIVYRCCKNYDYAHKSSSVQYRHLMNNEMENDETKTVFINLQKPDEES